MKIITKDLFEAGYLMSKGMQLNDVLENGQTVLFQFEGDETLGILKTKYDHGRASANVSHLRKSINHLRDILFAKIKHHSPAIKQ